MLDFKRRARTSSFAQIVPPVWLKLDTRPRRFSLAGSKWQPSARQLGFTRNDGQGERMCGWPTAQSFLAGCSRCIAALDRLFVKGRFGGGRRTGRLLPSWIAMPDGAWWMI